MGLSFSGNCPPADRQAAQRVFARAVLARCEWRRPASCRRSPSAAGRPPRARRGLDAGRGPRPAGVRPGGVAGHAGLFSTAEDLAVFAQMMLGRGQYGEAKVFSPASENHDGRLSVPGGLRGLGGTFALVIQPIAGRPCRRAHSATAGSLGTALWIDPQLDLAVVFRPIASIPTEKRRQSDRQRWRRSSPRA